MLEDDPDIIDSIEQSKSEAIQNVKNIDSSYSKREGISWLQENNIDKNIDFQFKEIVSDFEFPEITKKDKEEVVVEKKGTAVISEDDSEFFTKKGWKPVAGRGGKGWTAETTVKKEKLDEFMSMAFNPDNFENGKIKEDSEIYQMIQRAKKGGSRRMKKVEQQLKRYAQGIKNLKALEKEGFDPPSWANKLVDEVKWLLTTTKRRK